MPVDATCCNSVDMILSLQLSMILGLITTKQRTFYTCLDHFKPFLGRSAFGPVGAARRPNSGGQHRRGGGAHLGVKGTSEKGSPNLVRTE